MSIADRPPGVKGSAAGDGKAMKVGAGGRAFLVAGMILACIGPAGAGEGFRIGLPLRCIPGVDCVVQNYPDVDPTPAAGDHACGHMTYDGHTGTDFRIAGLKTMKQGVEVLAAADGTVSRIRDGIRDNRLFGDGDDFSGDRDCGNGVVIDHPEGWSTQYCHMREGSVRVTPEDRVTAGTPIGLVGLSGRTGFPHLGFIVRKGGTVLDPFTRLSLEAGCGADGAPLWTDATALSLAYRPAAILNIGFAPERLTDEDVERGRFEGFSPDAFSKALVFFGRAVGLVAGDVEVIEIRGPDGSILISHAGEPVSRPREHPVMFAGRKIPKSGWPKGTYTGIYRIIRTGQIVGEGARRIVIE